MFKRKPAPAPTKSTYSPPTYPPVTPLRGYAGPVQAFTVDPTTWGRESTGRGEGDVITTHLIVDHPDYFDAVAIYFDEDEATYYVDLRNARRLVEMLQRDVQKLDKIRQIDPEDSE
jgi:hypothetical protein